MLAREHGELLIRYQSVRRRMLAREHGELLIRYQSVRQKVVAMIMS
jgi:hypothetical protein